MSAPTIELHMVTDNGGSPQNNALPTFAVAPYAEYIPFGNVQAGFFSAVKVMRATFTGNGANTIKFWMSTWSAPIGNSSVAYEHQENAELKWDHMLKISPTWVNPLSAGITDGVKSGDADIPTVGGRFGRTPESEPAESNFVNDTVAENGSTDFIYMCLRPAALSEDGITSGWGFRLSFLYP